jgi:hypothetical protein
MFWQKGEIEMAEPIHDEPTPDELTDDELANEIKKNPWLGRVVASLMLGIGAWATGLFQMKLSAADQILLVALAGGVTNAVSWPIAHALNSTFQRTIVPLYWWLFPKGTNKAK